MAKPFGVVYLLTNSANDLYYVGQTTDVSKRMWQHRNGHDGDIGKAIYEFGWKTFHLDILGSASDMKSLNNLERLWIIILQATKEAYGYNLRLGGFNKLVSERSRQRMSEAQKKLTHQYWLGKKRPDVSARNIELNKKNRFSVQKRNTANTLREPTPVAARVLAIIVKRDMSRLRIPHPREK